MVPIHNILHPTDFSDRSDLAFRLARSVARDYGANLIILHVVQETFLLFAEDTTPPPPGEEHLAEVREQLRQLQLQAPVSDVRVTHRIEEGNPAAEILRVAEMIPADLIVMGTHGRRGFRRLLMGSVAERVGEHASCPVLTVRMPFSLAVHASQQTPERLVHH